MQFKHEWAPFSYPVLPWLELFGSSRHQKVISLKTDISAQPFLSVNVLVFSDFPPSSLKSTIEWRPGYLKMKPGFFRGRGEGGETDAHMAMSAA